MVLTRGIEHPHIRFAISSLKDDGLFWDGEENRKNLGARWEKFWEKNGISHGSVVFMEQVHGDVVGEVQQEPIESEIISGVDALTTKKAGVFLAVKSADCLPVLLYDPVLKVIAAVHAGWKGTQKEIVRKTVQKLAKEGCDVQNIHAILGPAIGVCCYEVSRAEDDRVGLFEKQFGPASVVRKDAKIYLNLVAANTKLLLDQGIVNDHIINLSDCTSCGVIAYPSYYRDKTKYRLISMIGITE